MEKILMKAPQHFKKNSKYCQKMGFHYSFLLGNELVQTISKMNLYIQLEENLTINVTARV